MKKCRGMTLIELLVALLLLSALSVGILSALRTGHRAYATVQRAGRSLTEVATTQKLLRRIIESASPLSPGRARSSGHFALEGSQNTLMLNAPAPEASAGDFYQYELSLAPRADGARDLVIHYGPKREQEVLLERVKDLRYGYLTRPDSSRGVPSQWLESWREAPLPLLVRVAVVFESGDARAWPELMAAPRLTQNAQCVFDVISGSCREEQ